jgi:hypothetical protein
VLTPEAVLWRGDRSGTHTAHRVWAVHLPSASTYRAAAEGICKQEEEKLNKHVPSGENLAPKIEFVAKTNLATYNALARLKAPANLASLNAEVLTDLDSLLRAYPPLIVAAKKGLSAYVRAYAMQASRDNRLGADVERLWKKLDVPICDS